MVARINGVSVVDAAAYQRRDDNLSAEAARAYKGLLAAGGRLVVTSSKGNGYRPVLVVVGPGFDASKKANVQTHYHGDGTSVSEASGVDRDGETFGETTKRVQELLADDPQTVFVLPEAGGNVGEAPTDWSNVSDEKQTTADALAAAGITLVGERTVSAHSAGGRALAAALARPGRVEADRLVLLDCLYEPAATRIRQGLLADTALTDAVHEIVIVRGTNPKERVDAFAQTFGVGPLEIDARGLKKGAHYAAIRFALDGRFDLSAGSV